MLNYTLGPLRPTKEMILQKVPEEQLMEHYLGIPVKKGLFKSPLRPDNHPTCAFYRNAKGDLIFKDFRGDFSGNAFAVVMYKFNCTFYKALQIIANDFNIIKRPELKKNKPKLEYTNSKFKETKQAIIQVEIRPFQEYELNWWKQYGITEKTLKKFRVYSCKNVFLNGNLFKLETQGQLIFGYYGGCQDGVETWKLYFPNKRKYRFISNWKATKLQGAKQLPKEGGDVLIIQKALKDVMCLYEFGIPSIAPNSENVAISEKVLEKLKSKFKRIIFWYDNDTAGKENLEKLKQLHPEFEYFYIPEEYGAKDFSDFRKKYGVKKSKELLDYVINRKQNEKEEKNKGSECESAGD